MSTIAVGAGDSSNPSTLRLLESLKSAEVSLRDKHKVENEIRRRTKESTDVLQLVKSFVLEQHEYIYKKLILDCELEARNVQYLVDLTINSQETELIKYGLLKYFWIFKEESPFSNPKSMVDQILPVVSFTMRHLILWRLVKNFKNESRCEELYQAVESHFGPSSANILLPACSLEFVENIIQSKDKLKLTYRQLTWLIKIHPKAAVRYIKMQPFPSYPQIMRRVVQVDAPAFMDIFGEAANDGFRFNMNISNCPITTTHLLKNCLERLLKSVKPYKDLLHKLTIFKLLGRDGYMKFFVAVLPETREKFSLYEYAIEMLYEDWIHILPSKIDKGEFFKDAFELAYGATLINCPDCISPSMLKIFSVEDREKYADLQLSKITTETHSSFSSAQGPWIASKSVEEAIPKLKALIAQESDHHNRQQLICNLVQACSINHDSASLNQVIKYYADRHRNERQDTHHRFISEITSEFEPKNLELDQNALHYLVEVLKICLMGLEKDANIYIADRLLEEIYFNQIDNCLSTSWILPILFKKKLEPILKYNPTWNFKKSEHLSANYLSLIERMVERMDSLPLKTAEEWCRFIAAILQWCQDWNKHSRSRMKKDNSKLPSNLLSIKHFPNIEEKLSEILDCTSEIPSEVLQTLVPILLADRELARDPHNSFFRKCLESIPEMKIILHFIQYDTTFLKDNWEAVSNYIFNTVSPRVYDTKIDVLKIIFKLKRNSYVWHLAELQKVFNTRVMDTSFEGAERVQAVSIASVALSTDVFMNWVANYYPRESETTTGTVYRPDTFLAMMTLRKGIGAHLKNIQNASCGLPALLHFCAGDYLKYSLGSLYAIVLNSGLKDAREFLTQLTRRPAVSVKKHGIRLMAQISPKVDVCSFISSVWENDEHPTIRHVLLKELLNRVSHDAGAWQLLKTGIRSLNVKDKDALEELTRCGAVPNDHFQEYVELVWQKYQDENLPRAFHFPFVKSVLQPNIMRVSSEWIVKFLEENLFAGSSDNSMFQSAVTQVLTSYLFKSSPEMEQTILATLDSSSKKYTPSVTSKEGISLFRIFGHFMEDICRSSFHGKDGRTRKKDDLVRFFLNLQKLSVLTQESPITFSMKLCLKFTAAMHSVQDGGGSLAQGKLLGLVLDEYVKKHGQGIFPVFTKQLIYFVHKVWTRPLEVYTDDNEYQATNPTLADLMDLASGFLESSQENENEKKIAILGLLPESPKADDLNQKYVNLLNQITKSDSFLVQLYYSEWALSQQ